MNDTKDLVEYFDELAKESFKNESVLYKKMKNKSFKDVYALTDALYSEKGFDTFQDQLKIAIYGENYQWIECLYDNQVIKKIVSTGNTKVASLFKVNELINGKSIKGQYFGASEIRGKGNKNVKAQQLNIQFKKLASELTEQFANAFEDKKFTQPFLKEIQNAIEKGLKMHNFKIQADTIIRDKNGKKISTIEGKRFQLYELNSDTGKLNAVFPKDFTQIFLTKEEVIDIIKSSTEKIVEKQDIKYTTSTSTFTVNFNNLDIDNINILKSETISPELSDNIAEMFLNTIQDAITTSTLKNKDVEIPNFNNYKDALSTLIANDAHLANEIYKVNTEQSASGTIGELMFAMFLRLLSNETTVQILGQQTTNSGQGAVDILLTEKMDNEIKKVGFQIKNYSSIGNTIVLYPQSNRFYDIKTMERYIEESYRSLLYEQARLLFLNRKMEINSNEGKGGSIDSIENILIRNLPNYIRYSQADEEKFGFNNFYIINFHFIPSSVIFETLSRSLNPNNQNKVDPLTKNVFFFSNEKQDADRNKTLLNTNGTLIDSWDKTWVAIRKEHGAEPNFLEPYNSSNTKTSEPNIWKEDLYLNFTGMQISFKNQLNILFNNAK